MCNYDDDKINYHNVSNKMKMLGIKLKMVNENRILYVYIYFVNNNNVFLTNLNNQPTTQDVILCTNVCADTNALIF